MTLNKAKEILRYNKDMLTFDPLYGEEVEPWYYGKDAEDLYNAIVCVEDCLKKAIPIEWIIDWLNKQTIPALHTCDDYEAVEKMLKDWEKENEVN